MPVIPKVGISTPSIVTTRVGRGREVLREQRVDASAVAGAANHERHADIVDTVGVEVDRRDHAGEGNVLFERRYRLALVGAEHPRIALCVGPGYGDRRRDLAEQQLGRVERTSGSNTSSSGLGRRHPKSRPSAAPGDARNESTSATVTSTVTVVSRNVLMVERLRARAARPRGCVSTMTSSHRVRGNTPGRLIRPDD